MTGECPSRGELIWWAITTLTTVGYGDRLPTSPRGRGIAVVLILVGVGLFGLLAASLASFFLERGGDRSRSCARSLSDSIESNDCEMDEPGRPFDRGMVVRLGLAACENAQALVTEADLLHDAGHTARAFALTILACEELGKGIVCLMTRIVGRETDAFQVVFGSRRQQLHQAKIAGTVYMERELFIRAGLPFESLSHELTDAIAGQLFSKRNRALYVDLKDNRIVTPDEIASDEDLLGRGVSLRRTVRVLSVAVALDLETGPEGPGHRTQAG